MQIIQAVAAGLRKEAWLRQRLLRGTEKGRAAFFNTATSSP
jgi:hypothetical protein